MSPRFARFLGWAAYFCGITAVLGFFSIVLFFGLESWDDTAQGTPIWGPISDVVPIIQMPVLLFVARGLYQFHRLGIHPIFLLIGAIGMLGVALLQLFLVMQVIPFEQQVVPVVMANGLVGIWLIGANYLSRQASILPARLAWLGIVVGACFVVEPLLLSAAGGAASLQGITLNMPVLIGLIVPFLVSYGGFPIWAFWLGNKFIRSSGSAEHSTIAAR
jgi:hypothetical protein